MINKYAKLALVFVSVVFTEKVSAVNWSWEINNTSSTFTGTESESLNSVSGSFSRLSNGFKQYTINSASGPNVPGLGTQFFPVEVPGFFFAIPPILDFENKLSMAVSAGVCPAVTTTYNWVFAGWQSNSNTNSSNQASLGRLTWDVNNDIATIDDIYNVVNFSSMSWFPGPINLPANNCAAGSSKILGPAGTDQRGDIFLSSTGGFVYRTEADNLILGFPEQTITSAGDLDGLYAGYVIRFDANGSISTNNVPIRTVITPFGQSKQDALADIANSTVDSGYGVMRLNISSVNSPANGMFQGTLERNSNTGSVGCAAYTTSTPQTLIICAGQSENSNGIPANIILVEQPFPTIGALNCDGGTLATSCTVNSAKVVADGEIVLAKDLVVQNGGSITSPGKFTMALTGDLTIQNGGSFNANVDDLVAEDMLIQTGGSYIGNVENGNLKTLTIESGATMHANGLGFAGGTNQGNGLGTGGGLGHNDASGDNGASGGSHGGAGGQGDAVGANNTTYGSLTQPVTKGSGGGSGQGNIAGGAGGGHIHLTVDDTFLINGTLSANGINGSNGDNSNGNDGGGGGAGGSIWLDVGVLNGTGTVSVNGGRGGNDGGTGSRCGGSGGGGRLSVTYNLALLAGSQFSIEGGQTNCNVASSAADGAIGTENWSPSKPLNPLPDMILWLDAKDLATVWDSDGDTANQAGFGGDVDQWRDKSGSAADHHFTDVAASRRPNFNSTKKWVEFDGVNDVMTTGDHADLNLATVNQRNITIAFRTGSDVNSRQVIFEEGGTIRGINVYIADGWLGCSFWNVKNDGDGSQPFVVNKTPVTANQTYYVTYVYDYTHYVNAGGPDGYLDCYLNGQLMNSRQFTTSRLFAHSGDVGLGAIDNDAYFETGPASAGNANYFGGKMMEVMYFNSPPTPAEVTNVYSYLSSKWDDPSIPIPRQIGGLRMWLDANNFASLFTDTGCTTVSGLGEDVACWKDLSGHDNHLKQANASLRPKRRVDSSKRVVEFTADYLTSINNIFSDTNLSAFGGEVFIVSRVRTVADSTAYAVGADPIFRAHIPWGDNAVYSDMGNSCCGNRASTGWGGNTTNFFLWNMHGSTTGGHVIRRNRTDIATTANLTNPTVGGVFTLAADQAGTNRWEANISEVIVYEKKLTPAERTAVEDYLYNKWIN